MLRCTTYIKQANQEVERDLYQERHISLFPDAGGNFKLKTTTASLRKRLDSTATRFKINKVFMDRSHSHALLF